VNLGERGHVARNRLDWISFRRGRLGHIALLAQVARVRRAQPNGAARFEPLSADAEQLTGLREAISALTPEGRAELYVLIRVGQGDLAAQDWDRGLDEAAPLGEQAVDALLD